MSMLKEIWGRLWGKQGGEPRDQWTYHRLQTQQMLGSGSKLGLLKLRLIASAALSSLYISMRCLTAIDVIAPPSFKHAQAKKVHVRQGEGPIHTSA